MSSAFDTFGFLAFNAVEFFRKVEKIMNNNVMTAGLGKYIFRRIGFAIERDIAAQFVVCLPSIFV